jgi:hypothetical protein
LARQSEGETERSFLLGSGDQNRVSGTRKIEDEKIITTRVYPHDLARLEAGDPQQGQRLEAMQPFDPLRLRGPWDRESSAAQSGPPIRPGRESPAGPPRFPLKDPNPLP